MKLMRDYFTAGDQNKLRVAATYAPPRRHGDLPGLLAAVLAGVVLALAVVTAALCGMAFWRIFL